MAMDFAVLFDMDGVLFDSEPIHERIFSEYAEELGFAFPPDEYVRLIGTSSVSQWRLMKERFALPGTPQELSDAKMERYKAFLRAATGLDPIPGVPELLAGLRTEDVPFALASSNTTDVIEATLSAIGLTPLFVTYVGGNDVTVAKPAPDIFLLAAQRLGADPARCVVIEDSTNGILAARRAGMTPVGFENPNSPGQDLSGAALRVSTLAGLTPARLLALLPD
ncbi:HAD family hydrolase [Pseudodesulfovibrio karagichevae]|uniref:HAD family hydrolase n=1 Tax=Pseudodesulfovibrio karagichevae TaxID=3239305 RepID=A0ABV4K283_9BACT